MRFFPGRVGLILASVLCASGACADDAAFDCMDCDIAEAVADVLDEAASSWLLSVTFDDPGTRFGVALGVAELATPFERSLMHAGIGLRAHVDDRHSFRDSAVNRCALAQIARKPSLAPHAGAHGAVALQFTRQAGRMRQCIHRFGKNCTTRAWRLPAAQYDRLIRQRPTAHC